MPEMFNKSDLYRILNRMVLSLKSNNLEEFVKQNVVFEKVRKEVMPNIKDLNDLNYLNCRSAIILYLNSTSGKKDYDKYVKTVDSIFSRIPYPSSPQSNN